MIVIGWRSTTGKFCSFSNCSTIVQCVNGVKTFPEAILEVFRSGSLSYINITCSVENKRTSKYVFGYESNS